MHEIDPLKREGCGGEMKIIAFIKDTIITGSGTEIQDINRVLKQFMQMQKMMKKLKSGGMTEMMRRMQGMLPR